MLIGTKDFEIKLLKEDAIVWDTKETASVTALAGLSNKQFAYAVGNGTIGVYEAGQRLWRVKVRSTDEKTFTIKRSVFILSILFSV